MANALLYYDNLLLRRSESVVITWNQSIVNNFDLIYVNDKLASTMCQFTVPGENTGIMVFDFGAAIDCYGAVVINTDLGAGDDIKFMGNAADVWFGPTEDEFMTMNNSAHCHHIIGAVPWTFRYLALKFYTSAKLGQVFLLGSPPYSFAQNVLWKFKNPNPFTFQGTVNPTGEEADTLVHEKFKERFALFATATAQKDILLEACRRRYCLWDIDGGGVATMNYGKLQLAADQTKRLDNTWGSEYLFTENPYDQVT